MATCPALSKCQNTLSATLTLEGTISYTFTRGCAAPETEEGESCTETGRNENFNKNKECSTVCEGFNCNANNDVEELFARKHEDGSLYSTSYGL